MNNPDLKPVELKDGTDVNEKMSLRGARHLGDVAISQVFDATIRRALAAAQHFAKLAVALTGGNLAGDEKNAAKNPDDIKKALDACACFERLASGVKALYQGLYGEDTKTPLDPGYRIEFTDTPPV